MRHAKTHLDDKWWFAKFIAQCAFVIVGFALVIGMIAFVAR